MPAGADLHGRYYNLLRLGEQAGRMAGAVAKLKID
jgi:hypothetical protein